MTSSLSTHGGLERTLSAQQAIGVAKNFCRENRFDIDLVQVGTVLKTTVCSLADQHGRKTVGKGKGVCEQSIASAVFEAIEHYYYEIKDLANNTELQILDLSGYDHRLTRGSPDFRLICNGISPYFSRIIFGPLHGNEDTPLLFPAFLTNPNFRSNHSQERNVIKSLRLWRYATNSGTASGCSQSEALLHAILEVIERDAIGIALLETIIRQNPKPARLISVDSLPIKLKAMCKLASAEAQGNLSLWNITSDLGIPAFMASLTTIDYKTNGYFGTGCSVSAMYAAERAILEAVQSFHNYTRLGIKRQTAPNGGTAGKSNYARCFLEAGIYDYRGSFCEVPMPQESLKKTGITIQEQIDHIVKSLDDRSVSIYSRTLRSGDIWVEQVAVPSLERFHLVSLGLSVAPGERGRQALI